MDNGGVDSIRDTPLRACIGARILDITADDFEEVEPGEHGGKVYFHLDNGQTLFATIGHEGEGFLGLLDMEAEGSD
jgi:hypothetical protein